MFVNLLSVRFIVCFPAGSSVECDRFFISASTNSHLGVGLLFWEAWDPHRCGLASSHCNFLIVWDQRNMFPVLSRCCDRCVFRSVFLVVHGKVSGVAFSYLQSSHGLPGVGILFSYEKVGSVPYS